MVASVRSWRLSGAKSTPLQLVLQRSPAARCAVKRSVVLGRVGSVVALRSTEEHLLLYCLFECRYARGNLLYRFVAYLCDAWMCSSAAAASSDRGPPI